MSRVEEILELIRRVMPSHTCELARFRVLLFGSRAEETAHERSDFDIGVDGAGPLPLEVFYRIEDALDELPTLYYIDWVDLNNVSRTSGSRPCCHTKVLHDAATVA